MGDEIYFIPKFNSRDYNEKFSNQVDNLKLLLEKYIQAKIGQNGKINKETLENMKDSTFGNVANFNMQKIRKILERVHNLYGSIGDSVKLKTASRLSIGLGTASILETSLRLHHIYGIPYIPSTAVKGILRFYNILKIADFNIERYSKLEKEIKEDLDLLGDKGKIIKLFGNQSFKGEMIILDAFPEKEKDMKLEKDVMNVHYPEYYKNGEKPPTDNQSPNPIKFLTVKKDAYFIFYFGKKSVDLYKNTFNRDLKDDLKEATVYLGLGAKTSIGYGMFE